MAIYFVIPTLFCTTECVVHNVPSSCFPIDSKEHDLDGDVHNAVS